MTCLNPIHIYECIRVFVTTKVAIALDGGEIIYFELDMMGQLLEERKRDMGEDILCMDVAPLQVCCLFTLGACQHNVAHACESGL